MQLSIKSTTLRISLANTKLGIPEAFATTNPCCESNEDFSFQTGGATLLATNGFKKKDAAKEASSYISDIHLTDTIQSGIFLINPGTFFGILWCRIF